MARACAPARVSLVINVYSKTSRPCKEMCLKEDQTEDHRNAAWSCGWKSRPQQTLPHPHSLPLPSSSRGPMLTTSLWLTITFLRTESPSLFLTRELMLVAPEPQLLPWFRDTRVWRPSAGARPTWRNKAASLLTFILCVAVRRKLLLVVLLLNITVHSPLCHMEQRKYENYNYIRLK